MMPTRRDFFKTTAALVASPYLPTPVAAQRPAAGFEVFADFESGTYDGWKLEGNCWDTAPASDQTFAGRVRGFEGKRFLCTLHPQRGVDATGRATSREFRIERPFIDFLIGGGKHPGEACLNLMVDGKVVQTATGDNGPKLDTVGWDVSEWRGKTAHFEVVDSSRAADRGYVMVDAIRLSDTPLFEERVPGQNTFFCFSKEDTAGRAFQSLFATSEGRSNRALTDFCVDRLTERLALSRNSIDRNNINGCAQWLRGEVDRILSRYHVRDTLTQQLIAANACSAFSALLTTYDDKIAAMIEQTYEGHNSVLDFSIYRNPATVLQRGKAVCGGIAALEQRFAVECRDLGLECFVANGHTRHLDDTPYRINNHAWTLYYLAERSLWAPSDATHALSALQAAKTLPKRKFARASLLLVDPLLRDMYSLFHYVGECRVGFPGTDVKDRIVNVTTLKEWNRFQEAHPYVLKSAHTTLVQLDKEDATRLA